MKFWANLSFAGWSNLRRLGAFLFVLGFSISVIAQSDPLIPKAIEATGIPAIPPNLPKELTPYSNVYGLPLAGWSADKREILLKGVSSSTWVSRITEPGGKPVPSSIYIRESGIYDLYFQRQGKYVAYTRDAAGNETFQLYVMEVGGAQSTMLSDGKSRNTEPVWSNAGDKIVYSSTPAGESGVNLRLIDPFKPASERLIVKSSGGYLKAYDWSPDDKKVVFLYFTSNTSSTLGLLDVATGNKTTLSPAGSTGDLYDYPEFSKDGKGIYVVTDHESDTRRIAYVEIATGKFSYLPSSPKWEVDEIQLAPDGKKLAYTANEDGISRLHVIDLAKNSDRAFADLPAGTISDPKWNANSTELAFNFTSSQTANDVYSVNLETGKYDVWARSTTGGLDTNKLSAPELIHWPTFDKRSISGFLYRPPSTFKGKRPVIINIHGGPEDQYRPSFGYDENYLITELGIAIVYPNVRGSTGYGKQFTHLDDLTKRDDAVRDLGALLDWIRTQPKLDADRVLVEGVSYGGYLSLSVAYAYSESIKGAISESGITNLPSFVEHTEGWRRDIQRAEFGDERDPSMKKFMEKISPLNNADKIKKPLLIIHGQNDPRVPVEDVTKLVAATKTRIPVWFILAKDEGHGFVQQANRDYRTYAKTLFIKEFLLK